MNIRRISIVLAAAGAFATTSAFAQSGTREDPANSAGGQNTNQAKKQKKSTKAKDPAAQNAAKSTSEASRTIPGSSSNATDENQISTQGSTDTTDKVSKNPATATGAEPNAVGNHGAESSKTPNPAQRPLRN
jgi:hypothetical protein